LASYLTFGQGNDLICFEPGECEQSSVLSTTLSDSVNDCLKKCKGTRKNMLIQNC
jgi:hypothetical protein